ncbi:protein-tyrosine phosphatase [Ureibacillus xyleni]|uniref:Tyrosine-protein phosphatase n=1 Tax=Ureibacillus xyleni TaxID=614648 RepID=A0A285RHE7_9BACL|nr:CpsB/CapC family capsule biosynthesis tyrosine phosphatase [Ureibacillus xyleni]SOB93555.1 protein-tyrosine phosphatase [Ureibacillus xyleni]
MVDLHSHLLWSADDGPATMEQTIEMLKQAVCEGISEIVATSHFQHPLYSVDFNEVYQKVNLIQLELIKNNIPIKIHLGHEVRLSDNILNLYNQLHIHTLANSKYMLIELPSNSVPYFTPFMLQKLTFAGITPIIAHPERNRAIYQNPRLLEELIRNGAYTQITAGSIAGLFGRNIQKFSFSLIKANLIHTYGSDAHNLTTRPFLFKEGLRILQKRKLSNYVNLFLENNECVIMNEPLTVLEPKSIKKNRWFLQ